MFPKSPFQKFVFYFFRVWVCTRHGTRFKQINTVLLINGKILPPLKGDSKYLKISLFLWLTFCLAEPKSESSQVIQFILELLKLPW